jgi:hypothetical protein
MPSSFWNAETMNRLNRCFTLALPSINAVKTLNIKSHAEAGVDPNFQLVYCGRNQLIAFLKITATFSLQLLASSYSGGAFEH